MKTLHKIALTGALAAGLAASAAAVEVTVTIENLAPENGGVLTPLWVGFQNGEFDLYDLGAAASPGLESLAEDGSPMALSGEFQASGAGTTEGVIFGPNAPVIFPGETTSMTFMLDENSPMNRYFTYASMVIPSNDAFVATANPKSHPIFDGLGNFIGADFVIYGSRVRDAGTEVNDEAPATTAFFGQAAPNTGTTEGGVVTVHPGFQTPGSGGILDAADFANADFTRPGYAVARIKIEARPGTKIRIPVSGDQEVPAVMTDALGSCDIYLNRAETRLSVRCDHEVDDASMAHIHTGAAGTNGPVLFDLGSATSPIEASFDVTADQVETLLAGDLYVNIHSPANPAGEIRGQIDGCFDGPDSLCLNEGRFQVNANFTTPTGQPTDAGAIELREDSGLFYFSDPENAELTLKVLDACGTNSNRFWVFIAGLTDLEVEITVEDTEAGVTNMYRNAQGQAFQAIQDTGAFDTCP